MNISKCVLQARTKRMIKSKKLLYLDFSTVKKLNGLKMKDYDDITTFLGTVEVFQ